MVTEPARQSYPIRNWRYRRGRSLAAWLVYLMLRVVKRMMPADYGDPAGFVNGTRRLAARSEGLMPKIPADVRVESFRIGEVPAHRFTAPGAEAGRVLLYLQGGGYIMGSPMTTHRDLIWRLSQACGCAVVSIEYGLAPENQYPVALDQAVAAYRYLLEQFDAAAIALAGDSAGGCLALATALRLRDDGLPMPAALCLLSAETDLTGSGESVKLNIRRDHVIPAASIGMVGTLYAGAAALTDPYVSPVFGEYHGFPPTLLQVGGEEVFLDDSLRVAAKLKAAGIPHVVDIWQGMPHVWQGFAAMMPEGRAAIEDIGRFVRGHLRRSMR